jgi:predicted DNA binding protein
MSRTQVIADITIPADSFALGQILDAYSNVSIRLERIVPLQSEIIPLFWVSGTDEADIKATLEEHPQTKVVQSLTTAGDEELFEVRWQPDINGLIGTMIETNARLLEAEGSTDNWEFRLRFPSHDALNTFNQTVTDGGIAVTLRRLYNPTLPEQEPSALSDKQREAIEAAYRSGYFDVPRDSTAAELADSLEISASAYSQRLRRGLATLVGQTLMSDTTPSERSEEGKIE